jgi:2-methylfumaryl-CoA isomerase
LAAERHRRQTEEGQFVKLALADVALATMGHLGFIAEAQINGEARKPVANHIYGTFGHDFECKDGHRVMVVGVSPNQWKALVKVTQSEDKIVSLEEELKLDFSTEGDRFKARERIQQIFSLWFVSNCFMEVKRALDEGGVCWGPYQSISDLVSNDPDCSTENPLFSLVDQPGIGEYLVPSQPIYFTGLDSEAG